MRLLVAIAQSIGHTHEARIIEVLDRKGDGGSDILRRWGSSLDDEVCDLFMAERSLKPSLGVPSSLDEVDLTSVEYFIRMDAP